MTTAARDALDDLIRQLTPDDTREDRDVGGMWVATYALAACALGFVAIVVIALWRLA